MSNYEPLNSIWHEEQTKSSGDSNMLVEAADAKQPFDSLTTVVGVQNWQLSLVLQCYCHTYFVIPIVIKYIKNIHSIYSQCQIKSFASASHVQQLLET